MSASRPRFGAPTPCADRYLGEGRPQSTAILTTPSSAVTGKVATGLNAGRHNGRPVQRSKIEPWRGHSTVQAMGSSLPSCSGPSSWEQRSSIAWRLPSQFATRISRFFHSTRRIAPRPRSRNGQTVSVAVTRRLRFVDPVHRRGPGSGSCRGWPEDQTPLYLTRSRHRPARWPGRPGLVVVRGVRRGATRQPKPGNREAGPQSTVESASDPGLQASVSSVSDQQEGDPSVGVGAAWRRWSGEHPRIRTRIRRSTAAGARSALFEIEWFTSAGSLHT